MWTSRARAGGPDEVISDPLPFKEGVGAVYGALYDVRGFVGAQVHPVELCRAGRDSQADGEDTLSAPVRLRRAHSVEPGSSVPPRAASSVGRAPGSQSR
jgi:hypothetical protein